MKIFPLNTPFKVLFYEPMKVCNINSYTNYYLFYLQGNGSKPNPLHKKLNKVSLSHFVTVNRYSSSQKSFSFSRAPNNSDFS